MKRIPLLISCLLIVLIMILTSCVQKDSPSTDPMPDESPKETASPPQTQSDVIIRLGMQFQEDSVMAVYQAAKEKFEADNPGAVIEFVLQERPVDHNWPYPSDGKNSPDIYFEWAGQRLIDRRAEGYLARSHKCRVNGRKCFLKVPSAAQHSMVSRIWYPNPPISASWYGIMSRCSKSWISVCLLLGRNAGCMWKIKAADKIPFAVNNKAHAGNWGEHIISRIVGEAYSKALMGELI